MADGRNRRPRYLLAAILVLASLTLIGSGGSSPDLRSAAVSTAIPVSRAAVTAAPNRSTTIRATAGVTATVSATATATAGATVRATPTVKADATANSTEKPNIVFILMDDASMNLLKYMPQVQQMKQDGTTFSKYYVTDSLCCPSRASIFSGRYPHNTGIYTNEWPNGGYRLFHHRKGEMNTFATDLQAAGYRTALMGKYLNGYSPGKVAAPGPVPPGWDEWAVGGMNAYSGFNYKLNVNGKVRQYGKSPKHYVTDVLTDRGTKFIRRAVTVKEPFLLELAPYAPHSPYTPAPRDRHKFPGLKAPRTPAYDSVTQNAPAWLAARKPLSKKAIATMDRKFRLRVQSVQAIDRMISRIEAELVAQGIADDTYLFLSSDNGFHLGEHRLQAGKQTAFDTDIQVPLVVTGPGVPAGRTIDELAENIDLRPTFAALSGAVASPTVDGQDLSGLLHGGTATDPREAVLVEHHGPVTGSKDPDRQPAASGYPPTYTALRSDDWLYVEYLSGEREYYDTAVDPHQLNNIASTLSPARLGRLHDTLKKMQTCTGTVACWDAQRM